jgi:hypothetical protein
MATNPALENTVPNTLQTPSNMPADAVVAVSGALNALLADTFALYVKTKNFHWHVSGPHFRDRGARAQDRRRHHPLDRPHRQAAAPEEQR